MVKPLPDEPFQPSGGPVLRSFSVGHLRYQNPFSDDYPADRLADRLERLKTSKVALEVARRLRAPRRSFGDDREILTAAVRLGHAWSLGAPWAVAPEAYALWAAVALILEACGVEHPNELPAAGRRTSERMADGSFPPSPPSPA